MPCLLVFIYIFFKACTFSFREPFWSWPRLHLHNLFLMNYFIVANVGLVHQYFILKPLNSRQNWNWNASENIFQTFIWKIIKWMFLDNNVVVYNSTFKCENVQNLKAHNANHKIYKTLQRLYIYISIYPHKYTHLYYILLSQIMLAVMNVYLISRGVK